MQLSIFKYEEKGNDTVNEFTTVEIDGEPWFVASEVCKLLDISNPRDAIMGLDEDEKLTSVIPTAGQRRRVNLVSESGLYNLIFKSRKSEAKKFRKWITKEVIPTIRKTGGYKGAVGAPNFVRRFNDNWDRVDRGHFSVISELFIRVYGRFEQIGYNIPDKAFDGKEIRPDNSVGRLFAKYLREKHPEVSDNYKTYKHKFPSGLEVDARQYPNSMLGIFIDYVDEVWMKNEAPRYLGQRDRKSLDYLPKLLGEGGKNQDRPSLNNLRVKNSTRRI